MIIEDLCGIEFDMEKRNCYTLVRDFYQLNFDIVLEDYACPTDWWENGLDIYRDLAHTEGFRPLDEPPHMWRPGDVILMALGSNVANHIGVIIPGGRMLHHLRGQRSTHTRYGGMFRDRTLGVYRHPEVPEFNKTDVELKDVLPKRLAQKLAHAQALYQAENLPE